MIYKGFNSFIPNLSLSVIEYYTSCYDIQYRILEDPIMVLSYKGFTILGFESKTKESIINTSFVNDTPNSKQLFTALQNSHFFFTIWYKSTDIEELHAEDIIFTTVDEMKGYMHKFLKRKGDESL